MARDTRSMYRDTQTKRLPLDDGWTPDNTVSYVFDDDPIRMTGTRKASRGRDLFSFPSTTVVVTWEYTGTTTFKWKGDRAIILEVHQY